MSDNLFDNMNQDQNSTPRENGVKSGSDELLNQLFGKTEEKESSAPADAAKPAEQAAGTRFETVKKINTNSSGESPLTQETSRQEKASPFINPYFRTPSVSSVSDGAAGTDASAAPSGAAEKPAQAQPVSAAPAQAPKDYNDGFYHQRFTAQSGGNHVNVTRPSAQASGYTPRASAAPGVGQQTSQRYATRMSTDSKPRRKKERSAGMSKGGVALLLVVCILISGAAGFGGSMLAGALNQPKQEAATESSMVIHKVDTEAQIAGTETTVDKSTSEITTEVADTVVEITTEVMQTSSFYGQYISQGAGSGVIISEDGYILTNNHVIDGASSIKVTTRSGDSYDATLIGTDSEVDIAVLKIEATGLPAAVFGDSDALQVGSKAVIIGNPLGTLGGSVTEGIISALDRSIVIDGKTMHLMQTDAAINPGNSGGGMFNGQGELSGIVVAKSSSEEIDNIGFVIPINNVLDILSDLKEYGYVRGRADTGMTFIDLTNQMYAYYYYGNNSAGVYISSVDSGSNAESAGFRKGDRVVKVDGQEISSADDITSIISAKSAGDTVSFELDRGGSSGTLELTLEEDIPDTVTGSSSSDDSDNSNSFDYGGNGGGGSYPQQRPNPFGGLFG